MEKVDIVIIGAGVIGLAIAARLASKFEKKEIVVLEQYTSFGQETSSRNSEVIHAGIYYPTSSLKAKLCVEGNARLYEICKKNAIPFKKIGKLIIASNEVEIDKIHELYTLGKQNGVKGLCLLSKKHIKKVEPHINAEIAIHSAETGIINSHELMRYFEKKIESSNMLISYNSKVCNIQKINDNFEITVQEPNNERMRFISEIVINCAGLYADKIAKMAGIDVIANEYEISMCKGEYFSVSNRHKNLIRRLIYPAPTKISLGIHTVIDLNNNLKLGPNAFYCENIDYNVKEEHKNEFYESARVYLPFLRKEDLSPSMSGIRAKLQKQGDPFKDFIIHEESDKNLHGMVNVIGIESPGLTASPAIAEYVCNLIKLSI